RQFKRMRKVLRRQRTLLGRVLRDLQRKLAQQEPSVRERIGVWLERAHRLLTQRPKDKQKLYALHAPEVECMSKGKARQPYEFGVKVGIAVSARKGLIVGARSFPGNPYDGDTLAEQLEQARGLLQDVDVIPQVAIVDLGYRGRDVEGVQILHRGQAKTLTWLQVVRARSSTPSSTMWPANMALEVCEGVFQGRLINAPIMQYPGPMKTPQERIKKAADKNRCTSSILKYTKCPL
ncbi:transposase, partial [Xanthomonas oryzae]